MGEVFFIVGLIGFLILPFTLLIREPKARWFWTVTMSVIGGVVVTAEIVGTVTHHLTISRMYWNWSEQHEGLSWFLTFLLAIGWGNLLVHLQWRVIKKHLVKWGWMKP